MLQYCTLWDTYVSHIYYIYLRSCEITYAGLINESFSSSFLKFVN